MSSGPERIGLVGGTGPAGRGLAMRLARAGHDVILGSRSAPRAQRIALEINERVAGERVSGESNEDAMAAADLVIITLPFSALPDTLPALAAAARLKLVVSDVVPLVFRDGRPEMMPAPAGSAAQEIQQYLPEAVMVAAFQTLDSARLEDLANPLDSDVIVCSDVAEARHRVMDLANELPGVQALSGGRLGAARYVEEVTALLITLNRIYRAHSGVRFTGIER